MHWAASDRFDGKESMSINYNIYAMGQKGAVVGHVFVPYRERNGCFPIFSEALRAANGSKLLQEGINKVRNVSDIAEAIRLVRSGGHSWRLVDYRTGQRNFYQSHDIVIHEV
jgi:hypothetical protein